MANLGKASMHQEDTERVTGHLEDNKRPIGKLRDTGRCTKCN